MLEMDPEPYDRLVALQSADPPLAAKVDAMLDRIEADPTAPAVRRRLIRPGRLWAISIDDHLILWDLDGQTPVVRYLGPDILR